MNERVSHHRLVSGVPRDAQNPVCWPHTSVQTLGCVLNWMHQTVRGGARSHGYSVMVSTEGHILVIERVSYHRVVLSVLRDAQRYELQSRTRVQKLR